MFPHGRPSEARVTAEPRARRRGLRIAFAASAAILAAGAAGGLLGFELLGGWFDTTDGSIHRVHYIGFGVLYGVLLTVPALAMTRRPDRKASAFFQVVGTVLAAAIAGLVADQSYLFFAVVVAAGALILLALHPARADLFRSKLDPSPLMGAFVLAGSVPLVWFGLAMARLQRSGLPADPHVQNDHWANMAAMAFGLVLTGLLASLRMPGWRITAWCAGLGVAVYGLASIVFHLFPGTSRPYPGSEGIGWGLVAMIGGLAFVVVSESTARGPRTI
jgi:hypothetical protein